MESCKNHIDFLKDLSVETLTIHKYNIARGRTNYKNKGFTVTIDNKLIYNDFCWKKSSQNLNYISNGISFG